MSTQDCSEAAPDRQDWGIALWDERLSVGNAIIDLEHRGLMQLVSALSLSIEARDSEQISQTFSLLEKWLYTHFLHEQKITRQANLFSIERYHAQQHLLRDLQYLKAELLSKDGLWSDGAVEHYVQYLKRWMVDEHILKQDMPIRHSLLQYPYDLTPA